MITADIQTTSSNYSRDIEVIGSLDVYSVLNSHVGNQTFFEALNKIRDGDRLMRVLGQYIQFNSIFASGTANLAGEVGVRQDLFRDEAEEVEGIADRSIEVAADIFFAAIDEFGDRGPLHRGTHRSLAQATLKAVGCYFGYTPSVLNVLVRPSASTLTAMRKVCSGYGVNQSLSESKLFFALGFHMASEVLANEEFRILDSYLEQKQADLVAHLKKTKVLIDGVGYPPYLWIHTHTIVEATHFDKALVSANHALRYYTGEQCQRNVKQWIVEGFKEFAAVQADFMEALMD